MTHRRILWLALAATTLALAALPRPAEGYENRSSPGVAPDGAGGVYVVGAPYAPGLWLQHLLAGGARAPGWPPEWLPVDTIPSPGWQVLDANGAGGAIVAYRSSKTGGNGMHAARADADALPAPGWPANGVPLVIGPIGPGVPGIAPDGTGGLYAAWQDFRVSYNDQDIYAQRLDGTGARPAGWPDTAIAVCDWPGDQFDPVLLEDGVGGFFAVWYDGRNVAGPGDDNFDIYAQRVGSDGAPKWAVGGVPISRKPGWEDFPTLAGDGAGGAYVAWTGLVASVPEVQNPGEVRLQRVTAAGAAAAGWPADGIGVGLSSRGLNPGLPPLCGDGSGGAYVAWAIRTDTGSGGSTTVRLQRIDGGGAVAGGWPSAGLEVETGAEERRVTGLFADGEGGAIVGWETLVADTVCSVRVQRYDGAGGTLSGWPKAGIPLGPFRAYTVAIVIDGSGGMTVVANDLSNGALRVIRVRKDGVVDPGWPGDPSVARLFPPYPLPAPGAVNIPFALPSVSSLEAKVFDVTGRLVRTLARVPEHAAGRHALVWDGRDDDGRRAPNGVYLLRVALGHGVASTRVVLAR